MLEEPEFWVAVGFVILGGLIGLLVGVSQVVLLEAWVKVEAEKFAEALRDRATAGVEDAGAELLVSMSHVREKVEGFDDVDLARSS